MCIFLFASCNFLLLLLLQPYLVSNLNGIPSSFSPLRMMLAMDLFILVCVCTRVCVSFLMLERVSSSPILSRALMLKALNFVKRPFLYLIGNCVGSLSLSLI